MEFPVQREDENSPKEDGEQTNSKDKSKRAKKKEENGLEEFKQDS